MSAEQPDPQILRERLLFGGLTALLSIVGLAIPLFLYAAPIPLGVLTFRQGMRVGTIVAGIAGVLTGVFVHEIGLIIVVLLLALGLALGGAMREGMKPAQSLLLGTVVTSIVFTVLFMTAQSLFDVNLIDEMFRQWEGLVGPEFEELLAPMRQVFPAMMVISAAAITFLNMLGIHKVLARRGIETPWFPPFRTWRFPMMLGLIYVALLVADMLAVSGGVGAVMSNIQTLLFYAFLIHGIAVALFYTREWNLHRAVIVIVFLFLIITPVGQNVMVLLGVVDSGLNVRRLPTP